MNVDLTRKRLVLLAIAVAIVIGWIIAYRWDSGQTTAVASRTVRAAAPLLLGALCGVIGERSGVFNIGIEEHRGRTDEPQDPAAKTGYVREDYALAMIEKAGFRFVAKSEVNANPKDTKDYAAGVWTLPPTYRLKDQDREKYTAIGESDRFLMKFVKP